MCHFLSKTKRLLNTFYLYFLFWYTLSRFEKLHISFLFTVTLSNLLDTFLLCSPFALFFSFLDFSAFVLLFVFCFSLHNFNEKHFFSSTILERFSNAYIILLQGRSQELLRAGSFGKLEDKFLESFWDKIAWKHPNDFSKYNYPDIQFTDKGNHHKPKYFYHEKFFCYTVC